MPIKKGLPLARKAPTATVAVAVIRRGFCSPLRTRRWTAHPSHGCAPVRPSSVPDVCCRICASESAEPIGARRSAG
uniref:Uncharacterized protein n=1 Tax=Tanacetum cinerariifolium TaxID=118510 RepID=A0A699XFB8_TANCI|nr:hypothetical protein [Tanacetum cinerariifolium]